jgi:amino acid adenylation domain-containing protein
MYEDFRVTASTELLHSEFERRANDTPEAVAVSFAGGSLTYRQLDSRAQILAAELVVQGAGPGAIIGICAERSPELVIALLAVLKSGSAYLPLDLSNPIERIALLLADAKPLLLLADAPARARLGAQERVRTLSLEPEVRSAEMRQPAVHSGARPDQDDLAYVIYTSGSTGYPKGVMCTHRGIVNRLEWMQERYKLSAGDRVLHKTSIGFDVSLWELFWPLSVGARLVLAPPGEQRHPEALADTIRAEGVTVAHFVPTMLMGFISAGQLERCNNLRAVMCSGEALSGHVRDVFLKGSKAELHNLYGPTEASVDVTHYTCRSGESAGTVPIGRAIKRVEALVLDERLDPVPKGDIGEICIAGLALARGYLYHPGLTAERFVPDPRGDGARLYRTGDRGRVRQDGELEFMGRHDDQVKIRGVRIELGEVEAALAASAGVKRCAVAVADGDPAHLIAYVVCGSPSSERLRAELMRRLPEQAVPSSFVYLKAIPTLPSGKVDRRALSVSDRSGMGAEPEDAHRLAGEIPQRGAELTLARIWRTVLGIHEVGTEDNFFTLGGDSIRSIEVVARARADGLQLTTADIFAHQTLRELARHADVARQARGSEDVARSPFALIDELDRRLMPSGVCDAMPLSSLLIGLLAESLENPHYLAYTTTLSLEGPYDSSALHTALAMLVSRHPVLRSAVEIERFSKPLQLVYETLPLAVSEIDARGLSGAAWEESLAEWLACERRKRFEWSQPPLLRVTVHRRDGERWQLTLSEPFLDGWSATLALAELLSLYDSYLRGEHLTILRTPRVSNRDLLLGERAALRSPEHRAFWKTYLMNVSATRLPRLAEDDGGVERQLRVTVPIPEEVACGLGRLARDLGVPLKSVLLAAHTWVLAALAGQREVVCGLMVNGRPEGPDGELAIGLFLNALPLRMRVESGPWAQLIHAAHAAEAEILPWRHYPYARILREGGGQTLFDSVFNFTHFRPYAVFADGEAGSGVKLLEVEGSDQTYFPLTAQFSLDLAGERVRLELEVKPDRFTAAQVEQFVDLHTNALVAMHGKVEFPHHAESLIGRREHGRRARWRAHKLLRSQDDVRLEHLFERRAHMAPDALAVFDDREQLTYECLAARARRLAHVIREHHNGAPQRVGVCMRRSPALLEAVLASLSLGAAFVPLDPAMPGERLDAVIGDSGLDLVVVDVAGAEAIARAPSASRLGPPLHMQAPSRVEVRAGLAALSAVGCPEDPAHIIYTSGSTGRPKGVVSTHLAVVNRLRWMWRAYPFRPGEVVCMRGSIGFVDSVTEIFNGLLCGVPTYLVSDEIREPHLFVRAIGAAGVTRLTLVPALLRDLLAGCDAEQHATLARIDYWVLSGEPLSGGLLAELRRVAPRATVLNLYGSTEVAGDVTVYECGERERDMVPAGIAIDGTRVRVLDSHGRETPSGTVGEIAVEGRALAIGYLGDPRLTAERFRPSPLGVGERLFRTGDIGRHRADGILEILGRRDRQVKINGVRVEPAEVEAALLSHPLVRACAVVATQSGGEAGSLLVAHAELSRGGVDGVELRSFLRARLPSTMVPGTVLLSAALPRTASGKLDPLRLPATPAASHGGTSCVAPRTAIELAIIELAATELGVETLMLGDDFFEQGGDSLTAVRLLGRLRDRFEVRLALRDIFDHPTLEDLCGCIELALSQPQDVQ